MGSCEKCWRESGGDPIRYNELLCENECTPEEQAGPDAGWCGHCHRKTIHQYTGKCMVPNHAAIAAAQLKGGV